MPGDCVALHTGQGNTWSNDRYKSMTSEQRAAARAIFAQGEPGFGISACEYMASRDIALQMGDTSANDAQPFGEEGDGYAVPCHTDMQTRRGIWNLENVDTEVAGRRQDLRRRVHLGAVADHRRHRLARQPGRAVLIGYRISVALPNRCVRSCPSMYRPINGSINPMSHLTSTAADSFHTVSTHTGR